MDIVISTDVMMKRKVLQVFLLCDIWYKCDWINDLEAEEPWNSGRDIKSIDN